MSQTVKTLKKIASGDEYRALEAAIKELNAESICNSYLQIMGIIEESEKAILERIQKLGRQNKDTDWQKCRAAFASRSRSLLPQWHWINSELEKQKIMEGIVFGFGTKGDPLVRTPQGGVVVLSGATLKEGDKVRFRVVAEGTKIDFGRVIELNADTFYMLLTQESRDKVIMALNSVRDRIDARPASAAELGELLKELAEIKPLTEKLRGEEKDRALARIQAYRKRLLNSSMEKLVFEFLAKREEKQIEESCKGDPEQTRLALSAPGLFRFQTQKSLKEEILAGEKPKGYSEIMGKLEQNLNSMQTALQLMDFESTIEEVYPTAKRYVERMDRLYETLSRKALDLAFKLEAEDIRDTAQIQSAIEEAFSPDNLGAELKRTFRGAEDFFNLRNSIGELRKGLGNTEGEKAEAAIHLYLKRVMAGAFGERRATRTAFSR
ncbi:MAG: hypothetical protein Q8O16_00385 [Dehalococcoidia bacterium]|nr:hypothetical protein [Dehalococcoidia bacterium]